MPTVRVRPSSSARFTVQSVSARPHDAVRVEERRLQDRVKQTGDRQRTAVQRLIPEVGHELLLPAGDERPRLLLDEEPLLSMQEKDCRRRPARYPRHGLDRSYSGTVIVPSWSVRSTVGGNPAAMRPGPREAISSGSPAAR